jgi:hypothetical protein
MPPLVVHPAFGTSKSGLLLVCVILLTAACASSYGARAEIVLASFVDDISENFSFKNLREWRKDLKLVACTSNATSGPVQADFGMNEVEVLQLQNIGTETLFVNPYFDCLSSVLIQEAVGWDYSGEAPVVVLLPHGAKVDETLMEEL